MQNFGLKIIISKFGTKNVLFGYFSTRILKNYISNQNHQIRQFAKFSEKTILPKFVTKNAWFPHFWATVLRNYCRTWNQHPQVCLSVKFPENKNGSMLDKKFLIRVVLQYNFEKLLSCFKSSASNLSNCKILPKKQKLSKFGTKNALFWHFWATVLKKLLSYLKSAPSNLWNCKILGKNRNCLNLGWKMPYLGVFQLEFKKFFVIFENSTI